MTLLQQFKNNIITKNLFSPKDALLLAVSGGIDSVVLAALFQQSGFDFAIAHCNFQLRGNDSNRDEAFVQQLAEKYDRPFFLVKFDTKQFASQQKISTQEAARELRYNWFEKIRKENGFTAIVTAHHGDDNIETVMMNFFRGTGIRGLRGMEAKQGNIVRPLLFAKRKELESFLKENDLAFVTDISNETDDYTRNYFRNKVIPFVEQSYPEAASNVLENINRFKEIEVLYKQAVEIHKSKLVEVRGDEIHIPVLKLKKTYPLHSIVYELISSYHFSSSQTEEVMALLDSDTGKYVQSSTHRIIKNRAWLIIAPLATDEADIIVIDGPGRVHFAKGDLLVEHTTTVNDTVSTANNIACLDAGFIRFPLLLRKWKAGDYFYPLGMQKKKKLSRFFIDQKLSTTEKEQVWVIEMDKKIVWIVGHRIDDRLKLTPSSKSILTIRLLNA